jgi:hypothetical protein
MKIDTKRQITQNAEKLRRLYARIEETVKSKDQSPEKYKEWQKACKDFHSSYDILAFPGSYKGISERLISGDQSTIETAICFLECRPYFFRSGYIYKEILKKLKKAQLSTAQSTKLKRITNKNDQT